MSFNAGASVEGVCMQSLRDPRNIVWRDVLKRRNDRPVGGGPSRTQLPPQLSSQSLQYTNRMAPQRGIQELLEAYRTSPRIRSILDKIGYHFAIVPWTLHEKPGRDEKRQRQDVTKYKQYKGEFRHKNLSNALRAGKLVEIETHPLLDLLNSPNPEMGGVAFRDLCCKFLDFCGESFQLLVRDGLGIPFQLWPLPPTWITGLPNSDSPFYEMSVLGNTSRVPINDMIYVRRPDMCNPYTRGSGIGFALGDYIDLDYYATKFKKSFYFNNAKPDMLVSLEGASDFVLQNFASQFENRNRGALRGHRTFFTSGKLDVKELNVDEGAKGTIPTLDHIRDTFISVFGVPPEIMGVLGSSNRATINASQTIFARECLTPRLELFADEWQRQLAAQFDPNIVLSYQNPVPEDEDFNLSVYKAAPWAIGRNEWRSLGGLPPEEPNCYMVPQGSTSVEDPSIPVLAPGQPAIGANGNQPARAGFAAAPAADAPAEA